MVGCYVIEFGCWWEPWGEVGPINGTIGSGFFRKSEAKMASQRIKLAPGLTVAVYPIVTTPMEVGSGVMMVVVFYTPREPLMSHHGHRRDQWRRMMRWVGLIGGLMDINRWVRG